MIMVILAFFMQKNMFLAGIFVETSDLIYSLLNIPYSLLYTERNI